jgi:pimeloyl-ACP methyl ester carboxylesterase
VAKVLLLPGALCTAAFYDDLVADPRFAERGARFTAVTPPGFGGEPAPPDVSVEGYARIGAELAREHRADVIVAHSYWGNVTIEMAAIGAFTGPVVLLSPCFSREDEEKDFRVIDRIARVPGIGRLPYLLLPRGMNSAMKGRLPAERHDALVAEMLRTDMKVARPMIRKYFDHLDRHGSLVARLAGSGVPAWVVYGEHDEIGLTDAERAGLEAAENVTLVTVPGATHMLMTDQPEKTADIVLDALARAGA